MGNQQGKGGGGSNSGTSDPSSVGTRETIAAWHRMGVSVWDVYESIETLGQGHMGMVYQVRRKDRGVHNEATRNKSEPEEEPEKDHHKKTPKIASGIKKSLKPLKRVKSMGSSKRDINPPQIDEEDQPPPPELAEPPKSPTKPTGILKKSHYSNPRLNDIPDLDEVEAEDELMLERWREKTGGVERQEQILSHKTEILEKHEKGEFRYSVQEIDPLTDSPKVYFKRHYACKTVQTSRVKDGRLNEMANEIDVMRTLDHPYILKLYEIYQTKRKLWLITELCTGGNLSSRKLMEPEVAVVMEQILRALAYMHGRGVVHSDLKLENILYENKKLGASIRLIDFGLSKAYDRAEVSRKAIGTAYHLSPEIVSKTGKYTDKTDIWSLGVCAWILLSGDFPFIRTEADLDDKFKLNRLINAQYKFGITWTGRGISNHARHFVQKCLKKNPKDRWSAREALEFVENTWIPAMQERYKDDDDKVIEAALNSTISARRQKSGSMGFDTSDLERFCTYGQMKKTILMTMAQTMDNSDVGKLNEIFLMADTEDTGTLNYEEFKNAISEVNPSLDATAVEALFKGVDQDRSGEIHYAEFIAALAESQGLVTLDRLAEAFDRIDSEGKGYITPDDLKLVLGKDYNQQIVNAMIKEADYKKNGQIDYEELLRLMFKDNPATAMDALGDVNDSLRSLEKFRDIAEHFNKSRGAGGSS